MNSTPNSDVETKMCFFKLYHKTWQTEIQHREREGAQWKHNKNKAGFHKKAVDWHLALSD